LIAQLEQLRAAGCSSRNIYREKATGASLTGCLAQQNEAARRRAQGATLQELADSYDRSISTMRRATRAA
jgi:hypothetical protein